MPLQTSVDPPSGVRAIAVGVRAALIAALIMLGSLGASRFAMAHGAAEAASAGLAACSSNGGKALYDCVANVLDGMSGAAAFRRDPEAKRALQTTASQLRAAVNKVQALSAISQCRAAIAGTLRQIGASGGEGSGLSVIAGVLAQAARLIQSKG
jgi:hypothetical protein